MFNQNDMQSNFTNYSKMFKWIYIISFIFQWSILSMILNLVTLGKFRLLVFVLFLADAFSMINKSDKTFKCPSFILSKLWVLIDRIDFNNLSYKIKQLTDSIQNSYQNLKFRFKQMQTNMQNKYHHESKYKKERNQNKFADSIGDKVIIEYINSDKKLKRKSFKYRDRALSFIHVLQMDGFRDFTSYNLNLDSTPAYIVVNKKRDFVDLESNSVKLYHNDNDYKFVAGDWPKK